MSEPTEPTAVEGSSELGQRLFGQAMALWIEPEIERRQQTGQLEKSFALRKAQVVFHIDGRGREVRLNDEARIGAIIRLARAREVNLGDEFTEEDIAAIEELSLLDDDDPNAGHISLYYFRGNWHTAFDFRYNRGLIKRHLEVAKEFLESAREALVAKRLHAFADNLFSAAELAAKALLLGMLGVPPTKASHRMIHARFNQQAAAGTVEKQHRSAFNDLARARVAFRYLEGEPRYSPDELASWLSSVENLLRSVRERHGPRA